MRELCPPKKEVKAPWTSTQQQLGAAAGSGPGRRHQTPALAELGGDLKPDPERMDLARVPRCWPMHPWAFQPPYPFQMGIVLPTDISPRGVLSDSGRDKGIKSCQTREVGWQSVWVFFSLERDHRLLARDPPLLRIYMIPATLQATTKL